MQKLSGSLADVNTTYVLICMLVCGNLKINEEEVTN